MARGRDCAWEMMLMNHESLKNTMPCLFCRNIFGEDQNFLSTKGLIDAQKTLQRNVSINHFIFFPAFYFSHFTSTFIRLTPHEFPSLPVWFRLCRVRLYSRLPLLCKEGLGEVEVRKWSRHFHSGVRRHFNDSTPPPYLLFRPRRCRVRYCKES